MNGAGYKAWKVKGKTHDINHDLTFSAHTINCVCHNIRSMFRVLGIYNFGLCPDKSGKDENEKAVVVYIFPFFPYTIWTQFAYLYFTTLFSLEIHQKTPTFYMLGFSCNLYQNKS